MRNTFPTTEPQGTMGEVRTQHYSHNNLEQKDNFLMEGI
jgi:hypothetical protein